MTIIKKNNGLEWVFNPNDDSDISKTNPSDTYIKIESLANHLHAFISSDEIQKAIEDVPEYTGRISLCSGTLSKDLSFVPYGIDTPINPIAKASFNDGGKVAYYLGNFISYLGKENELIKSFVLEFD